MICKNILNSHNTRFYLQINNADEFKSISDIPLNGIITDNIDLVQAGMIIF